RARARARGLPPLRPGRGSAERRSSDRTRSRDVPPRTRTRARSVSSRMAAAASIRRGAGRRTRTLPAEARGIPDAVPARVGRDPGAPGVTGYIASTACLSYIRTSAPDEELTSLMASKIHLRLPILSWLPGYRRAWLARDVVAGVTVVALLVPEGMAYAQIAGLPPHTAFYAAPIGLLMYAMFGTSRQLVVAVSAAVATVSHTAVSAHAEPGTPEFV